MINTVLNLILHMEKNNFNFEKRTLFWSRSSIASYIHVMRIHKMLISYVRLDHTSYLVNYGITGRAWGHNDVVGTNIAM